MIQTFNRSEVAPEVAWVCFFLELMWGRSSIGGISAFFLYFSQVMEASQTPRQHSAT